tara:strand:+ start:165 stop:419 length:255 start_codon:yes stop_codon:yes gene_type:complete
MYTWEDFLQEENIINPYLYENSRRLRRQIRRLRHEYQQRRTRQMYEPPRNQRRHHERRVQLQDYSRHMTQLYNQNPYDELFIID